MAQLIVVSFTPFTLESNVMLNHSVACIPLVNRATLEFLFQLQPDRLVMIVHVHVNVLCRVDMSVKMNQN